MAKDTFEAIDLALEKINRTSSLDDLDKAVLVARNAAEAASIQKRILDASKEGWVELFKASPGVIVPLAALLTVVVTTWIQFKQLEATRQQGEDTQWRELLKSAGEIGNAKTDATFAPRLRSFMRSSIYSTQAADVAKSLLGNILNKTAFDDLLSITFPDQSQANISDIVTISHNLSRNFYSIFTNCQARIIVVRSDNPKSNIPDCSMSYNIILLSSLSNTTHTQELTQSLRDYSNFSSESLEISKLLSENLRAQKLDNSESPISLRGAYVYYANFSKIDFSNVDLTDSIFDQDDFTDASLNTTKILRASFNGSNWWNAKFVAPQLLNYLVNNQFPGWYQGERIIAKQGDLTKEAYFAKVSALFKKANTPTPSEDFKFGTYPFSVTLPPTE